MLQEPVERHWIERFARGKEHRVETMPGGVHIGPMFNKQFHHGRSRTAKACPHERRIASFVNVGPVVQKPLCYFQPSFGGSSYATTLRSPGERSISDWRIFQFGLHREEMVNLGCVISMDRFFQFFCE